MTDSVDRGADKPVPNGKAMDVTDAGNSVPASVNTGNVGIVSKANSKEPAVQGPAQDGDAGGGGGDDVVDGTCRSFSSNDALTVCGVSKVDSELPTQIDEGHGAARSVTLVRWVVMALLSLGFLTCLVTSKVSILSLAGLFRIYRNTSTHDEHANASHLRRMESSLKTFSSDLRVKGTPIVYGIESCVLWMLIILLVPNVATLILALLTGACRHDRPWPAWSAVAWVSLLYSTLCRHI